MSNAPETPNSGRAREGTLWACADHRSKPEDALREPQLSRCQPFATPLFFTSCRGNSTRFYRDDSGRFPGESLARSSWQFRPTKLLFPFPNAEKSQEGEGRATARKASRALSIHPVRTRAKNGREKIPQLHGGSKTETQRSTGRSTGLESTNICSYFSRFYTFAETPADSYFLAAAPDNGARAPWPDAYTSISPPTGNGFEGCASLSLAPPLTSANSISKRRTLR